MKTVILALLSASFLSVLALCIAAFLNGTWIGAKWPETTCGLFAMIIFIIWVATIAFLLIEYADKRYGKK